MGGRSNACLLGWIVEPVGWNGHLAGWNGWLVGRSFDLLNAPLVGPFPRMVDGLICLSARQWILSVLMHAFQVLMSFPANLSLVVFFPQQASFPFFEILQISGAKGTKKMSYFERENNLRK